MRVAIFAFFCMVVGGYLTLQAQGSVSIYESGRPVRDYEDNFKNLVSNWTKENISNAERYKLKDITFVETISGPERYNYYRNYFSSDKPVGSAISGRSGEDSEGNSFRELIITPGYAYTEFYDTRGMDERVQLDLGMEDARKFILEDLLIGRIGNQLAFSEIVKPGDKVYAIDFEYHMQPYTAYVVCNRETKKMVWDTFFGSVMIEKE